MNNGFNLFAEALVFVHGTRAESEAAKHAADVREDRATWKPPKPGGKLQGAVRRLKRSSDCANRKAA